jgi:hypothetical protein
MKVPPRYKEREQVQYMQYHSKLYIFSCNLPPHISISALKKTRKLPQLTHYTNIISAMFPFFQTLYSGKLITWGLTSPPHFPAHTSQLQVKKSYGTRSKTNIH